MSRKAFCVALILAVSSALPIHARGEDETTFYNSSGQAEAYVAEDFTIYLWSGMPVAYLRPAANGNGFDVYGFNGRHLGWYVRGVVRDHDGDAACGIKEVVSLPGIEPIKGIKQIKPIKAIREIAPIRPIFSKSWSEMSCRVFLFEGSSEEWE